MSNDTYTLEIAGLKRKLKNFPFPIKWILRRLLCSAMLN